ncbi:MAG TPA: ExbD/TolR family protein [Thermoanaerobaculia bacterium]|nr:ExbD/TolR family protein [Thermoanaerobaculia bacterium]
MLPRRARFDIFSVNMRSDINVTPLVDVCLVLLIIFMVVTPMLQKGVDVALPETTDPEKMPEAERDLVVSVKQDGTVFVKDRWITDENLAAVFLDVHENNPDRNVVLKGDRRIKYKRVREVMRLLNEAGFTRVALITEREGASA